MLLTLVQQFEYLVQSFFLLEFHWFFLVVLYYIFLVFRWLNIVFFQELVNNVTFSFCHLYSVYWFLFSSHSKRPPYDNLFYHRRPFLTSFTEKVSHTQYFRIYRYIKWLSCMVQWNKNQKVIRIYEPYGVQTQSPVKV